MKKYIIFIFVSFLILNVKAQSNAYKNLIMCSKGTKWGFCDTLGKMKIKPIYDVVCNFEANNKARVKLKNTEYYINTKGEAISPKGNSVFAANDSIYAVENNKIKHLYKNKNLLLSKEFIFYDFYFQNDDDRVSRNKYIVKKDAVYYLVDEVSLKFTNTTLEVLDKTKFGKIITILGKGVIAPDRKNNMQFEPEPSFSNTEH
jgi:hypothetical protein